jgi:hypothetical protein
MDLWVDWVAARAAALGLEEIKTVTHISCSNNMTT